MFKVFSRSTKISSHKTKNNNKTILQMAFQKSEGKGGRGGGVVFKLEIRRHGGI